MRYYTASSTVLSIGLALAAFFVGPKADARSHNFHYKHRHSVSVPHHKHHHRHHRRVIDANGNRAEVVGGRPDGCPRQFCACGIRKFFGMADRSLDLASNWIRKFQRSEPGEMKVAARSGHAFLLLRHIQGSVWLVHDWNSGGHKTRIHPRSIAGFVIVDPHSPRFAAL